MDHPVIRLPLGAVRRALRRAQRTPGFIRSSAGPARTKKEVLDEVRRTIPRRTVDDGRRELDDLLLEARRRSRE